MRETQGENQSDLELDVSNTQVALLQTSIQAGRLKAMLVRGHDTRSNSAIGAFTSAPDKDPLFEGGPKHRASILSPPLF